MASDRYAFDPAKPGKSYGEILAKGGNGTNIFNAENQPAKVVVTGSPMFGGGDPMPPTNIGNPFGYGMSIPDNGAGTMPSGDDRKAYEDAMANTYANVVTSPGLFGTDIGKQTGYTGQGSQSMAGIRAPSNSSTGGGAVGGGGSGNANTGPAPIPQVLISQDISQRTPSGTIYAPDLSAYNDSSLFNYTGPGGVDEYTYGQGLRMGGDYNAFGSPTDMANPYYEGQFAPLPASPADSAITMPAVQLPGGLPQIENNTPIAAIGGGSGTTNITPLATQVGSVSSQANPGLTQSMAGSDEEYQEMLTASLNMDNQLMNQLDSRDPRGGENELNKNAVKVTGGMDDTADIERGMVTSQRGTTMDDTAAIEQGMMQGTPNPQGGLPNPYRDRDGVDYSPQVTDTGSTTGFTDTADDRFKPAGAPDAQLIRKVGAGMADGLAIAMQKGQELQDQFGNADAINTVGSPNQFEIQRAEADANQAALDKERYNTQINNPTADFSGYMKNYGDGGNFTDPPPVESIFTGSPSAGIDADTAQQIAARTEALNAPDGNEAMLEALGLDSDFSDSEPPYLGRGEEVKNIFDEQQNYEVAASEMSPGEVGLTNGLIEGMEAMLEGAISVDGSGTDRVKSSGETQAWDKYYSYKEAGINALNKGDIDVKAFNELKGKAGSDTVIDHFVNKDTSPKINNFMSNSANLFYQAKDVLFGDDTIKEGITDYYQQMKGVNNDTKLGSIGEEIAKAKEATAQRKEVQENIFTPGPMKFAAAASKSKPKPVVVKSTPRPTQKNVISKPKPKPGGFAGAGATSKAYKKFASNYGGRYGL